MYNTKILNNEYYINSHFINKTNKGSNSPLFKSYHVVCTQEKDKATDLPHAQGTEEGTTKLIDPYSRIK